MESRRRQRRPQTPHLPAASPLDVGDAAAVVVVSRYDEDVSWLAQIADLPVFLVRLLSCLYYY